VKHKRRNKWTTEGLTVSRNSMCFLNRIKKTIPLLNKSVNYIKKYQYHFKKVIKEAKEKDNDRFIQVQNNRSKRIWQVINNERANSQIIRILLRLKIVIG
jgi:hypothetical protein